MPNGTYGGVRGRKTKVGRELLRFPPTRLNASGVYRIWQAEKCFCAVCRKFVVVE